MKKTVKQLLCILLTVLLLLGGNSAAALAAVEGLSVLPAVGDSALVANDGDAEHPVVPNIAPTYGASRTFTGDYYSQLNTRQKAFYDALESIPVDTVMAARTQNYSGITYHVCELTNLSGFVGASIDGSISGGRFTPSGSGVEVESGIYTDMCAGVVALRYDRPDMLWLNRINYGYSVRKTGSALPVVTKITVEFGMRLGGEEQKMYQVIKANARTVAQDASAEPDTYNKLLYVHDALASSNSYCTVPIDDRHDAVSHTPYSALVTGDSYEPVCQGYATAFKLICDELNIPCILASSTGDAENEGHMWNNVKMDDGLWYNVDVTWDDNDDSRIGYDYFLVGSDTTIEGTAFSKQVSHIEENPYDTYRLNDPAKYKPVTFKMPAKSKTAYEYVGKDRPGARFPDVPTDHWGYGAIESAAKMGLFVGNNQGLFKPADNITRESFALVVAKAMGATDLTGAASYAPFKDVAADRWSAKAVAWVKENKIMQGKGGDRFDPTAFITRQEMCVTLDAALKKLGHTDQTAAAFPDDRKIASWAKQAVYNCKALGLVQGDNRGYFDPLGNTTRAAAAVVFTKFAELGGELPEPPVEEPDAEKDNFLYLDGKEAVEVVLPGSWAGQYVTTRANGPGPLLTALTYCSKLNKEAGFGGVVFTVSIYSDNSGEDAPGFLSSNTLHIGEKEYYVVVSEPTDLQYDPTHPARSTEYNELAADIETIIGSLSLKHVYE